VNEEQERSLVEALIEGPEPDTVDEAFARQQEAKQRAIDTLLAADRLARFALRQQPPDLIELRRLAARYRALRREEGTR